MNYSVKYFELPRYFLKSSQKMESVYTASINIILLKVCYQVFNCYYKKSSMLL